MLERSGWAAMGSKSFIWRLFLAPNAVRNNHEPLSDGSTIPPYTDICARAVAKPLRCLRPRAACWRT